MRFFKDQRGFTLIEMMVVLAIIALIAVFAVPNVTRALQNSRVKAVESQARQIQNAFDQYYNDNNEYPPSTTAIAVAASTANQTVVYNYFFKPTAPQGVLFQYASFPDEIGDSLFVPVGYRVTDSATEVSPEYELILEVKNITSESKYIHITKEAVTRDATVTGTEGTLVYPTGP